MHIAIKCLDGQTYRSVEFTKKQFEEKAQRTTWGSAEALYREFVGAMKNFKELTYIPLNVIDRGNLNFNPANVLWVEIVHPITEWEEEE